MPFKRMGDGGGQKTFLAAAIETRPAKADAVEQSMAETVAVRKLPRHSEKEVRLLARIILWLAVALKRNPPCTYHVENAGSSMKARRRASRPRFKRDMTVPMGISMISAAD